MHYSDCPLPAVIQPAADTLATGQIKTLRKSEGFVENYFPFALVGE
jgi:hypothetical protein